MAVWTIAAAVLCAITWGIHTFAGERSTARPLRAASDIEATAKWTQFYCWHLITITLGAMAFGLGYAALVPEASGIAIFIGLLAVAFGILGFVLPPLVGQTFLQMPQGFLLLPIGVMALMGTL